MEPEPHKAPIRFYEIDLLRFLAALSVVFYHYTYRGYNQGGFSPLPFVQIGSITKYGYLGVSLFFIISGYVVLLSAIGKTVRQFFLSSITRLYPAFWAACTLTFLVKRIWGNTSLDVHMPTRLHANVNQYVYNMSMFQEFMSITDIDTAYWSLRIEIGFYFLISLLIAYKLLRYADIFLLGWLAYCAIVRLDHDNTVFDNLFFPRYAPFFAAGMLFYLLQQPQGRTWLRYALLLFSYVLAVRASLLQAREFSAFYHDDFSGLVVISAISVFFVLFYLIAFHKINLSRFTWLAWPGALTYPLYLLHSDIGFIAFHRFGQRFDKYFILGTTILLMLIASWLIHILVEKRLSKPLGKAVNWWMMRAEYYYPEQKSRSES